MENLHLPDNIKVHFASMEVYGKILLNMGVSYGLFSAYRFVERKVFSKNKNMTESDRLLISMMGDNFRHIIQDSGLFSLLYGAKKDIADKSTIFKWYDGLVEWTLEHGHNFTVVEVDCQDILGQEIAWDLRYRLRKDLPNNRIINVFHLSDGMYGLDRLIEFSDYIGIGSGTPQNSSYTMYEASSYIKKKNPLIDIHLLGCTQLKTIKKCSFCTSADSITWTSPIRFGEIGDYHIKDLDSDKVRRMVGDNTYLNIRSMTNEMRTNGFCASIEQSKRWYQIYGGNQDYTKDFQNK